jgi:hypothetical protein
MELFFFCLCASFAELAIYISINHQGMILNWLRKPLDKLFTGNVFNECTPSWRFGIWLKKPIYRCVTCMASFWTLIFWLAFDKPLSLHLLFAILICAGINKILCAFLEKSTDYGC